MPAVKPGADLAEAAGPGPASGRPERRREAFYGRLKGKRLRPGQEALLEDLLPRLSFDLTRPAPSDLGALFDPPLPDVRLEIGFGGGEHLLSAAARHPATGFIGAEPFVNGMAKLLTALEAAPMPNVQLYADDAARLLDWLPPSSLAAVDLLYPDPWPKPKHWKRRFVSAVNLARLARVLKPGGLFRFASDIDGYVDWTLLRCRESGAFDWTAASARDWREPFEGWPGTRYEAKAVREGRSPAYLSFRRRAAHP